MADVEQELGGRLRMLPDVVTTVVFDDVAFQVSARRDQVRISVDPESWVVLRQRTQTLPAEAAILDSELLVEERSGDVDYQSYMLVDWEDCMSLPFLSFAVPPLEIVRQYARGQSIELGIEDVACYTVTYRDGVQARFQRTGPCTFEFEYSTGFRGSCWRDSDGWCNLRFRGDRLEPDADRGESQSKFIISRCKYSDNLLLVFQDDATVHLS